MRVEEKVVIDAPRGRVWETATDPDRIPEFMRGFSRWEVKGRKRTGLGARYALRISVGSAEVGALVEIVEWDKPGDMSWTSITGLDHRFRLRLREAEDGGTVVRMKLSYQAPGGVLAFLADLLSSRMVRGVLRDGLAELKREIEFR